MKRGSAICLGLFLAIVAAASPVRFDIPAQSAQSALRAFNAQSGKPAVFVYDDLKGVKSNPVRGEYEPAEALALLLRGTGFEITLTSFFVVGRSAQPAPTVGTVRGTLRKADAQNPAGISVIIGETGQRVMTDRHGNFAFIAIGAGNYRFIATADGYQPLHLTDVHVKAATDVTLGTESLWPATDVTELKPYVVHAQTVSFPETTDVLPAKTVPFADRNVDLPRTVNDAQPYYIFDRTALSRSGALNVEEFLKKQLTMNAATQSGHQSAFTNSARPSHNSLIDLRGLGAGSTLVLVNGRRRATVAVVPDLSGIQIAPTYSQPDLNNLPLVAIDRIEVLPSSASGIYGGGAIGGVVNVILKDKFSGVELAADYGTTWDGHAPLAAASVMAGQSLENGRTDLLFVARASTVKTLSLRDRPGLLARGYTHFLNDDPTFLGTAAVYGGSGPPLGSTVNIGSATGAVLTLKGSGTSLNSTIATLPANYAYTTPSALGAAVIPGKWNLENPDTNQLVNGGTFPLGTSERDRSFFGSVNRKMTRSVEMFAEFSYASTHTSALYNPFGAAGSQAARISSLASNNPFNQDILVSIPLSFDRPDTTDTVTRSFVLGAKVQLPGAWRAEIDYAWSGSANNRRAYSAAQQLGFFQDPYGIFLYGNLNPFDGTAAGRAQLANALVPYYTVLEDTAHSTLNDVGLRAVGPALHLPWGDATLSVAFEHRKEGVPQFGNTTTASSHLAPNVIQTGYPGLDPQKAYIQSTVLFGQTQSNDSGVLEANVPLVTSRNARPGLRALDLQAVLRYDHATVGVGSAGYVFYPLEPTFGPLWIWPVKDFLPFRSSVSYSSTDGMLGLRYQPIADVTLRAAYATAFLPPTYQQLGAGAVGTQVVTITDPKNGSVYGVSALITGNPNLKPQTSSAWDVGVIWEPHGALEGVRFNLQYSRITQRDAIVSLPAEWLLAEPDRYPGKIDRDLVIDRILRLELPFLNLTRRESSYFDASIEYRWPTRFGHWGISLLGTFNQHVKQQRDAGGPLVDLVGFPSEGGPAKIKANAALTWERRHWSAGWAAHYFGSYLQHGGPADPVTHDPSWVTAQGSTRIAADIFHDVYVGYAFTAADASRADSPGRAERWLEGVSVQLVVKNVLNRLPAFDAYNGPFYSSYNGDLRLRELALSVKKTF